MKLFFKFLIMLFLMGNISAKMVAISGNILSWQKEVLSDFLIKNDLNHPDLIIYYPRNKSCNAKSGIILHLCFKGEEVKIVHMDTEKIRETLAHLIEMNTEEEN